METKRVYFILHTHGSPKYIRNTWCQVGRLFKLGQTSQAMASLGAKVKFDNLANLRVLDRRARLTLSTWSVFRKGWAMGVRSGK